MNHNPLIPIPLGSPHDMNGRRFQGIPGFTIAPDGTFLACWYGGGSGECAANYVIVAVSRDQGQSWREVAAVDSPGDNVRAFDPTLWTGPDGIVRLFWSQAMPSGLKGASAVTDGVNGVFTTELCPGGGSPSRRLCDGVMLNKPVVLCDGAWAYPVSIWGGNICTPPPHLVGFVGASLFASTDNGQSLIRRGGCRFPDNSFDEHCFITLRNGTIRCLARTKYGIGESYSDDFGRSWSLPVDSGIPGPDSRAQFRRLASGNILMLNHKNKPDDSRARANLTAFISQDDGKSWSEGMLIDARRGVSYPDCCQDHDGTIFCIYDFNRTVEGNIILAGFTEREVLQGGALPSSRLNIVSRLQ